MLVKLSMDPTINDKADVQSTWKSLLAGAWESIPRRAQGLANGLVTSITVVYPDDDRLNSGYTKEPRAALIGDELFLSCEEDPNEIWHEIGHVIIDRGLSPEEQEAIGRFYDFSEGTQTPAEMLAEDFYFTVKGDRLSPFWQWWFGGGSSEEMKAAAVQKIAKLKRAANVDPLLVVEAVLDALADDLIYRYGGEEHVWFYGIAKEAIGDAQKEERLSYEDRDAPHQYYYADDLSPGPPRKQPLSQPLKVERPDVTMRGVTPNAQGLV